MPNQIIIQIAAGIFLIFAISRLWLGFKHRTISSNGFIFWSIIWSVALISIINPNSTAIVARLLGIGRGADVIIYTSIVLIFYLIFRTQVMIEDLRHEISNLVRKIALENVQTGKSNSPSLPKNKPKSKNKHHKSSN